MCIRSWVSGHAGYVAYIQETREHIHSPDAVSTAAETWLMDRNAPYGSYGARTPFFSASLHDLRCRTTSLSPDSAKPSDRCRWC